MAIIVGTSGNDTLLGGIDADSLDGLEGDDRLDGSLGADSLSGGPGNDTLIGGELGALLGDTLNGGAGDDVYEIANPLDQIVEVVGEGVDEVRTGLAAYTLGDNVETLTYSAAAAFTGTGNDLDNRITGGVGADSLSGGAGADTLNGGLGADSMAGGTGNDTYYVDDFGDVVTELSGEGSDTVRSALDYTLGDNLEALALTGSAVTGTGNALNNSLTGTAADNVLTGLDGNDTLNGGAGADTLIGGTGNDTYVVDNVGDVLVELPGEGVDTVQSSITHTLLADFENLTLTGSAAINGVGNAANNTLTGNGAANLLTGLDGDDTLNGGAGADTLVGGTGDDTYVVDNAGDVVTELAGEGTDTVNASVSWTLGDTVEKLTLTGSASINGTGNDLDNVLTGNGGANILDGGLGADTMVGGAGNDVYLVDSAGDVVTEAAGQGTDEVRTALAAYTLGVNVETLTYTGTGPFSGGGNALDNRLAGAGGDDSLSGFAGDDTLIGGAGADTLDGGSGTDTASYAAASGGVVVDLASGAGTAGEATGDLLVSIENLTGSAYADTLSGDGAANRLDGGAGADSLSGGAGNDTLIGGAGADAIDGGAGRGGAGTDTASYATASAGVAVDLASGTGTAGDAAGDALSGIENVTGGAGNDTLRGDGGANLLDGGAGDDALEGRGGNDTLIGGTGTDTAIFSGNVRDYAATLSGATWTIQALSGADGTDTLQGVEIAQFADATIRLDANNAPLIPNDLSAATDEDAAPLVVDLLQGAWDFEGSALSATGLVQTGGPTATVSLSGGALSLNPNQFNSLAAGQTAALTFAYAVSDGGASTARTLAVTVAGRNDAPVVSGPVNAATDEDAAPLVVNLLQGATDPDQGDTLSVTGFSQTGGRTVSVTRTGGTLTLDPAQFNDLAVGESATLTFGYGVTDGAATTAQTLNVTVQGRNDAPVAAADSLMALYQQTALISPAMLLVNDTDPDGDSLTVVGVGSASHGAVSMDPTGKVVFTADSGYNGLAAFQYTVSDSHGGTSVAMATLYVTSGAGSGGQAGGGIGGNAQTLTSLTPWPYHRANTNSGTQALGTSVAMQTDQSYIVAYTVNNEAYAQRFSANGAPMAAPFILNTITAGMQARPIVTPLTGGGFAAVWESQTSDGLFDIHQQKFSNTGAKIGGEALVNTVTKSQQLRPSTSGLSDGGWIVVWHSYGEDAPTDSGTAGVFGQRYAANGTKIGGEFQINTTSAGDQVHAVVTGLADGGWVVGWQSASPGPAGSDGSGYGIFQRRYAANGQPASGEQQTNVTGAGSQGVTAISKLMDGGWVTLWMSPGQDGSASSIYGRVFNGDGTARTGEFAINQVSYGDQASMVVTGLVDGGFSVAWASSGQPDASHAANGQNGVFGRRFDANGVPVGGEYWVSDPGATGGNPSIAPRVDGGYVVAWEAGGTAYAREMVLNASPVVQAHGGALGVGSAVNSDALVDRGNQWGSRWTAAGFEQYSGFQFVDDTDGGATGYFTVDGTRQAAGQIISVAATDMARVQWHAGSGVGSDTFRVRATDGQTWGNWASGTMTALPKDVALTAGQEAIVAGGTAIQFPSVTVLADGGYVVAWGDSDAHLQRYDAVGAKTGAVIQLNTTGVYTQAYPQVTALADGGYVAVWESNIESDTYGVFQQRFDGSGAQIGMEEHVNTATSLDQRRPSITSLADGGWVVLWHSYGEDAGDGQLDGGVYGQRYSVAGQAVGGEFRVPTGTDGDQVHVKAVGLTDGGMVITWMSTTRALGDASGYGVYQQRYDVTGAPTGGEQQVNTTTLNNQEYPTIAKLQDGGWVVSWESQDASGASWDAYARVYNGDGTARTGEILLNQGTLGNQMKPTVAGLAEGGFVAAWSSDSWKDSPSSTAIPAIAGRWFDAGGVATTDEFRISLPSSNPTVPILPNLAARTDGGYEITWIGSDNNGGYAVYKRDTVASWTQVGKYVGASGNDTLFGSPGSDTLTGGVGADMFLFTSSTQAPDTIIDFQPGQDRIEIVGTGFGELSVGQLAAGRFALNAPADADDRFVFNTTTGALSYDPDGNGAMAATTIALLNVRTLAASDIWVVAPT